MTQTRGTIDPAHGLRITASVVFEDTVTPDFIGNYNGSVHNIVSYDISSGPITFASGNADNGPFTPLDFTFSNGEITQWLVGIEQADNSKVLDTFNADGAVLDFSSADFSSNFNGNVSFTTGT